jgi:hypothetical protein
MFSAPNFWGGGADLDWD